MIALLAFLPSTLHSTHTEGKYAHNALLSLFVLTQLFFLNRPLKSGQHKSNKHSDQGYDSFSVSSSDSYPSAATSPSSKMGGQKLKQIPEDVHLLEMINASSRNECDHLFAEMEILLRRSYEKESEGDLRGAAALADSAASKARIAMDAPYSNHHTLIAAKMKYSMCVMRSTLLHRRVQEAEVEERRLMKASNEYNHSRQSSRDSTHGRHSRQGSREGKDPRGNAVVSPLSQMLTNPVPNVEIYATLPKRNKRKSPLKNSNGNLTTEESSCQSFAGEQSTLPQNSILQQLQNEQRPAAVKLNKDKNLIKCHALPRESDFSDYYSEWEGTKRSEKKLPLTSTSGWQSCRENDSEVYGEISHSGTTRKQCKVKRKLLLGGLLKSKNRSLPDLSRDETLLPEKSCPVTVPAVNSVDEMSRQSSVANIHRGFSKGSSRPSLVKVKPPLIGEMMAHTTQAVTVQKECIYANISQLQLGKGPNGNYRVLALQTPPKVPPRPQPPVPQAHCPKPVIAESEHVEPVQSTNPFLLELNKKRIEILSKRKDNEVLNNFKNGQTLGQTGNRVNATLPVRKPSTREIASFISRSAAAVGNRSSPTMVNEIKQRMAQLSVQSSPVDLSTIHMPIAVHANANTSKNSSTSSNRPVRPPDYETAMRRLELIQNDQRGNFLPLPPPPLSQSQMTMDQSYNKPTMPKLARQVSNSSSADSSSVRVPVINRSQRRKKKVSFSDQIEWVACSGDDPEVHLNPLLEKVLSNKHIVYTLQ